MDLVDDASDRRWRSRDLVTRTRLNHNVRSNQTHDLSQISTHCATISTHLKSDVDSDTLDGRVRVVQNLLGHRLDLIESVHTRLRVLQMLLRGAIGFLPGLELVLFLLVLVLLLRVRFLF